jgi:ketosteroid isomerase-like protein
LFDVVNPLQTTGSDAARARLEEWFASFQGPIGYELRDLSIAAGDDVAFSHSLSRVSATTTDGRKLDMWWRTTVCYRKVDGVWTVTHEHPRCLSMSRAVEPRGTSSRSRRDAPSGQRHPHEEGWSDGNWKR